MDLSDYNVVFVTLDSCTYETALKAQTPWLDSIGPLRKAETHGTYTLPAHIAFFTGNLPRLIDGNPYYFAHYSQIWRSSAAKASQRDSVRLFYGKTIMDDYAQRGFQVLGIGGVTFFDMKNQNNLLPTLFPSFLYYGFDTSFSREQQIPRLFPYSPLAHLDQIIECLSHDKPFFVFLNAPETHIPYNFPGYEPPDGYREAVRKAYREHSLKHQYDVRMLPLTQQEIGILKQSQVASLEWIDGQLETFCARLPSNGRPTLLLVCADHGEEFGEGGRFGHAHVHEVVSTVPLWCGIR
jgi:hypothetical protein